MPNMNPLTFSPISSIKTPGAAPGAPSLQPQKNAQSVSSPASPPPSLNSKNETKQHPVSNFNPTGSLQFDIGPIGKGMGTPPVYTALDLTEKLINIEQGQKESEKTGALTGNQYAAHKMTIELKQTLKTLSPEDLQHYIKELTQDAANPENNSQMIGQFIELAQEELDAQTPVEAQEASETQEAGTDEPAEAQEASDAQETDSNEPVEAQEASETQEAPSPENNFDEIIGMPAPPVYIALDLADDLIDIQTGQIESEKTGALTGNQYAASLMQTDLENQLQKLSPEDLSLFVKTLEEKLHNADGNAQLISQFIKMAQNQR